MVMSIHIYGTFEMESQWRGASDRSGHVYVIYMHGTIALTIFPSHWFASFLLSQEGRGGGRNDCASSAEGDWVVGTGFLVTGFAISVDTSLARASGFWLAFPQVVVFSAVSGVNSG